MTEQKQRERCVTLLTCMLVIVNALQCKGQEELADQVCEWWWDWAHRQPSVYRHLNRRTTYGVDQNEES